MSNCAGCKKPFKKKKDFHRFCDECLPQLCRCSKCLKVVYPKNKIYTCCGISETVDHVVAANTPSRLRGMSLEDMVFTVTHNMTPTQAYRFHFGDDALEDLNPNR